MANTIQFLEPINVEGSMSIDGVSLGTAAFSNQTIPTNNNQLLNGAGYITSGSLPTVSNATITLAAGTGLSGGSTFTLNQAASKTITFTNSITDNKQLANGAGYTTNTGTTTASNTQTFTNKSGSNNQWANDKGYTTNTGTTTASNAQTFTNKGGNISQWTNDSGYITDAGSNNYLDSAAFDTSDGVLTLGRSGLTDITVDLDGRYLTSAPNYFLNGITKSGNVLTYSVSGATDQTFTFGSNAFNSTTIPSAANNATISISAGSGMSGGAAFTTNQSAAETITLTNADKGSSQAIYKNITVSGQTTLTAASNNDTLNLIGGTNVTLTTDSKTGSVTVNSSTQGDITGVGVTSPITGGGTSGNVTIGIATASKTATGALTSTDWSNFNAKTSNTGTVTSVGTTGSVSGITLSGTVTTSGNITLGGSLSLTSAQITTGLGFTPYSDANPSGFTNNTGTVKAVSQTHGGNAFTVSGSPVNTSGTLAITMAGDAKEYIDGAGDLQTFPSIPQGDITGVTAGTGMTGGGSSGSVTLNVIGSTGITANANNIAIDSTVVTKTGTQELTNKSGNISQWTNDSGYKTTDNNTQYTAGSGLSLTGTVFANTAPNIVQTTITGNAGSATKLQTARTIAGVSFNGTANIALDNKNIANSAGYTTNTGTTTASNSQTFTNKGGNISQWTNDSGYVTSSGITGISSGNTNTLTKSGTTSVTLTPNTGTVTSSSTNLATGAQIQTAINTAVTGVLKYIGTWDAASNNPALRSGTGTPGEYYIVSKAGGTNLDGITDWQLGDWAVFSDLATDAWQKVDNSSVGDITKVTAGTDLTGGGVAGDVTLNVTSSTASTGSTIAKRDASGDLNVRLIRSEYDTTNASIGFIMTQVDTASNNYVRPSTMAQVRSSLNVADGATNVTNNNQITNGAGYTTNTGDITSVGAGTGISGGGTSGAVTITNSDRGSSQNMFKSIGDGKQKIVANANNDQITLLGCEGTLVTVNEEARTITICTDRQDLSISGTTLSIEGGNSVTLPTSTGPKGDTGSTGSQGPKGDQGDQGDQGIRGATGSQGPQGEQGEQGETGGQGIQGVKGDTGGTGAQGAKGDTGSQGPQGGTGAAGAAGKDGNDGAPGKDGAAGAAGAKGDTGGTGAQGIQGVQGDRGATGSTGSQGPQGEPGNDGKNGSDGARGATGSTGSQGPKGDQGDTGGTGSQGPQGNPGATGSQGPAGDKGSTGSQGPQGTKGDTGAAGANGTNGTNGSDGARGATGATGSQGAQGIQGPAGTNASAFPVTVDGGEQSTIASMSVDSKSGCARVELKNGRTFSLALCRE